MSTIQPIEVVLRAVAIAVGCAVTLRAARKRTPRGRACWRSLGVVCALVPCLVTFDETAGLSAASDVATFAGAISLGLLVGAFAVVRGLRGRRVGDHEYCRRCGFDLFGRPAGTRVCGECGTPLDAPRAIVVGQRRRRPQWLAFGGFVLAVTLGYLGSSGRSVYRWATTTDFAPYEPGSRLIDGVWSRNPTTAGRASNEINRRLEAGTLGRANVSRLITRLVDDPFASPKLPGVHFAATYAMYAAETTLAHGEIDEATARRAMRAALDCTLVVAPQASRGRTLRYWIAAGDFRLAREEYQAKGTLAVTNRVDALDGRPLGVPRWSTLRGASEWPGLRAFGNAFDLAGIDAPAGPATLTTRFTATLTLALPGRPTLVETRDVTLTGATTLVDASVMTCPPVVAAPTVAADGTIAPAATTTPIAPTPKLTITRSIEGTKRRVLNVRAPANGAILADVVLTTAGAERSLGTVFFEPNDDVELPFDDRPSGAFSIELRPVPARGADMFRVVPTFAVPVIVSSTAIVDSTGDE